MDRLPKHKELMFMRLRKMLYLRLTVVIRSLSTKFNDFDAGLVRRQIETLGSAMDEPCNNNCSRVMSQLCCILVEIYNVRWEYRQFILGKSGDGRSIKKLRAGMARLGFLRDNWDGLEVKGSLKQGYKLELR